MKRNFKQFTVLGGAGLIAVAGILAIMSGCGSGSPSVGLGGGGSSGSSSSGNPFVDVASGFMPNGTGGYLRAGVTLLSSFTLSPADEDQMGRSVTIAITNTYPVMTDSELNRYVASVGYVVVESSPRPDGNFLFGVLDTDQVGAYSGPNGYVMITRGALKHMRDESELAGVLGHEIAHVCHEDGLNAVRTAKQTDAAAQALSTALSNNNNGQAYDLATNIVLDGVFKKGYDRSQELDADKASVQYVADAGYDPAGYQRFVERIAAEQGGGQTDLFSTHPGFDERVKVVSDAVAATGKAGTGAANRERFETATARIH